MTGLLHFTRATIVASATILATVNHAQATKYAGEPYHLGVGGRAIGRGGAFTASRPDASSVFWNPATLTALGRPEMVFQHAETFGSLLNHEFIAVGFPTGRDGWAWGAYGTWLGGEGIQLTVYDSLTNRPKVDRTARHDDWSLVFALARPTARWGSWSVAVKAVGRSFPGNSAYGLGADLAWWRAWPRYRLGVKIADATTTFLSYDSGRRETINPHLNWAGEADLPQPVKGLTGVLAVEGETYFENRKTAAQYWSGSISVDLHLGFEVAYRDLLFGRIGSDAGKLALGAGVAVGRWAVDAAMTDHEFLDNTYRVSLRVLLVR